MVKKKWAKRWLGFSITLFLQSTEHEHYFPKINLDDLIYCLPIKMTKSIPPALHKTVFYVFWGGRGGRVVKTLPPTLAALAVPDDN